MKVWRFIIIFFIGLNITSVVYGEAEKASRKRILVVDSYHRGYNWSTETNKGFCAAMLKFGYFDNKGQIAEFTKNDYVETSTAVIKKLWMDTKRKKTREEIAGITLEISETAGDFKPDLIFLGDDNAARYIGSHLLDTDIPIVFWGVNNTPVKYGLLDSADRPGHNVTGVYQSGYFDEGLRLLKAIVPEIKTFAILSDETSTGRADQKALEYLAHNGALPVRLIESVSTNDYELWKSRVSALQEKVDAFFVVQYSALRDKKGNYVSNEEVAEWYITHIRKPEVTVGDHFVKQGLLCTANDSGFNQGFEAVVIAHDILAKGADPATYLPRTPKRGASTVNRQRAGFLGIKLTEGMGIEEYVDEASALEERENAKK